MPTATLMKSRSLRTQGIQFVKGVPQPVPYSVAQVLEGDSRFRVVFDPADKQEPEADENGRPAAKADRLAAIQDAIGNLDDSDGNYTADGKPDARALTSILGWQVTAKERDEAMANEVQTGEDLGKGSEDKKRGKPVLAPGESSETPTSKTKGDISEGAIKSPPKKKSTKVSELVGKPAIAGAKPEGSEAPSETGDEQPGEGDTAPEDETKPKGKVIIKHKDTPADAPADDAGADADPSKEGAKEV